MDVYLYYTASQADIDNNGKNPTGTGFIHNVTTFTPSAGSPGNDFDDVPITQNPAYTITKAITDVDGGGASGNVDEAGDVITYRIVVTNTGNQTLTNMVVSDMIATLGAPVKSVDADSDLDIGETWTYNNAIYSATQADIDNNGGGDGDIDNTATADCDQLSAITASASVPITQNTAFTLTKVATEASVDAAGDVIHYTITVDNSGDMTLTNISINDLLLGALTGLTGDANSDSKLDVNETWTYTGTYTVLQSDIDNNGGGDGDIDNSVTVDFAETDPPQTASASVPIVVFTDLAITKMDNPDPVDVDTNLTYYITVTNNGPGVASGITVNEFLPAGVTFISDNTGGQGNYNSVTNVWSGFGLASGASATLTLVVKVNSPVIDMTVLVNTIVVTGDQNRYTNNQ